MKMIMGYTYRSSNNVFYGQGTYTSDAIINVPVAIEEIRQKLHLDTPYSGVEITPILFTAEVDSSAGWKCCLVAFMMALAGGIVAAVVNTLIQSVLR